MKKLFINNQKRCKNQKPNTNYILIDSIKTINPNLSDLSVSLSGEFMFKNRTAFFPKFTNSDLEVFEISI